MTRYYSDETLSLMWAPPPPDEDVPVPEHNDDMEAGAFMIFDGVDSTTFRKQGKLKFRQITKA